jgi:NAD(P)H-dependent FMN reductase
MRLVIIDGSIRDAKSTPRIAKWVEKTAKSTMKHIEVEVVDLKKLNLPRFDESVSPMMNQDRQPDGALKQWLDILASADGYVFVTPEYNHGIPSGLKGAIDYIDYQIMKKPFITVGHGGVGAARAVAQLKTILNANIGAIPVPKVVNVIGFVGYTNDIDETGKATTDVIKGLEGTLTDALETLQWYMRALKTARGE